MKMLEKQVHRVIFVCIRVIVCLFVSFTFFYHTHTHIYLMLTIKSFY